jgi:hypothetical protein
MHHQDPFSQNIVQEETTGKIRGPLRPLGWSELILLAQEIRSYQDWLTVHQFALDLFSGQARYIVLPLDLHEGRRPISVVGITAYTSDMKRLPYDFTRPFWHRPLSTEADAPTILHYLDKLIDEGAGMSDLSKEERERFRQEKVDDFLDTNPHMFSELPAGLAQTRFDLAQPPKLTFPFVFVPLAMPREVRSEEMPAHTKLERDHNGRKGGPHSTGAVEKGVPDQMPEYYGHVQEVFQTSDHQFLVNEAGLLLCTTTSQNETRDGGFWDAIMLEFTEVLALADFVQQRREQLKNAQEQLDHTWRTVADELIDRFESRTPGSSVHATGEQIQQLLETLGPVTSHGYQPTPSLAGLWYQSLWTLDSYPATFGQQWVPFLRVFRQRCQERFPEKYAADGTLLDWQEE